VSPAEGQALALELGMAWAEVSNLTGSGGVHSLKHPIALSPLGDEARPC
jgi:hypothetical protein